MDIIAQNKRFFFLNDRQQQIMWCLYPANDIPMAVLGWKLPDQAHREL